MFRQAIAFPTIAALLVLFSVPFVHAQSMDDRIRSQHVRIRIPREREWMGRDSATELERCWRFMNAATGDNLPRVVLVVIDWSSSATVTNFQDSSISVGMSQSSATADARSFLSHQSAREMARLGLFQLSRGATARAENEFLAEGMAETLVHEYERSSRSLTAAWVISRQLDNMKLLGFDVQTAWASFSGGRRDLRAASPGITFLETCRELYGRDKIIKLFESLRKASFRESLKLVFKTEPEALEEEWLKRVRTHPEVEEVTVTTSEDAPQLLKTIPIPETCKPGSSLQLRLFIRDGTNDLTPWGIFLQDDASGRILQAQAAQQKGAGYFTVIIPVEPQRQPGQYGYQIVAVDESGNVRSWKGQYAVTL